MKKFFIAMALVMGAVLIAGCGKDKSQEFEYKYEGRFLTGENDVTDVRLELIRQGVFKTQPWLISAKTRTEADAQALSQFKDLVSIAIDIETKYYDQKDNFSFLMTLTRKDDNTVLISETRGKK